MAVSSGCENYSQLPLLGIFICEDGGAAAPEKEGTKLTQNLPRTLQSWLCCHSSPGQNVMAGLTPCSPPILSPGLSLRMTVWVWRLPTQLRHHLLSGHRVLL